MKRYLLYLLLILTASAGMAQRQQKWKAPKRPKRPKWEAPKQTAPEVIKVWRPYAVADNWFLDFAGGMSASLAENMKGHGALKISKPLFDFSVGRQFSNLWSTRLTLGYKGQVGWASQPALNGPAKLLLGDGDYSFTVATLYLDEMMSLTKLFCQYNELRRFDLQLFAGFGANYSFGFERKTESWDRYGYPVDGADHLTLAARGGLQALFMVSESCDLFMQGALNVVEDSYNGVERGAGKFKLDSYADVSLGVRVRLMDHYGNSRYYRVRRWEATSLRTSEPKVAVLLDHEHEHEYRQREATEQVEYGELMKTHIQFYVDRTFVNDYQMENIRIVSDFLRKNPDVKLVIKGYSGATVGSESPDMHLAQKRAESVKHALTHYYEVDPARLEVWFDEQAEPPFAMRGEWIDGAVFLMEK